MGTGNLDYRCVDGCRKGHLVVVLIRARATVALVKSKMDCCEVLNSKSIPCKQHFNSTFQQPATIAVISLYRLRGSTV